MVNTRQIVQEGALHIDEERLRQAQDAIDLARKYPVVGGAPKIEGSSWFDLGKKTTRNAAQNPPSFL